jgi:DNA invertase Pin-like site-specific DNA recombinase
VARGSEAVTEPNRTHRGKLLQAKFYKISDDIADAHKRRFDVVCVWRFDRFARSVSHLLRALETFKALGIDFVSLGKRIGRPTVTVDAAQIARLRASKASWREIGRKLGVSARTARRTLSQRAKPYPFSSLQVP